MISPFTLSFGWESKNDPHQQESIHGRTARSQYRRRAIASYDKTRSDVKQSAPKGHSVQEKTILQNEMVFSPS